ncbi:hypothetical protein SCB29_37500, partial [Paraburkholderia sp. SIMBA_055]
MTAGIDLALALIDEDLGHAVAMQAARRLLVFMNRPGVQSQFSAALAAQASAGGLAVGVFGALKDAGGVWFGWSGDVVSETVANAGPTL